MTLRSACALAALLLFFCLCPADSAVAQCGCCARQAEDDAPMLGCRLLNYYKYQEEGWRHLPAIGLHYVFLSVPKPEEVGALKEKLAKHGLKVAVMRGGADLSKPESVDELGRQTAVCAQMGAKYMFLSPKHTGASKEVACQRLRAAGELAKKNGVTIVLETHPDLGANAAEHLETMRAINHPNVRVNFDTGNITFYNKGLNARDELLKVLPYLATVEIKDHNGQYKTWNFPALGRGVVDIPGVLRILKEHGYHGPITMEIEGVTGKERSLDEIKAEIAESVKYMHSLGSFR